jgi:hypothetical protein
MQHHEDVSGFHSHGADESNGHCIRRFQWIKQSEKEKVFSDGKRTFPTMPETSLILSVIQLDDPRKRGSSNVPFEVRSSLIDSRW